MAVACSSSDWPMLPTAITPILPLTAFTTLCMSVGVEERLLCQRTRVIYVEGAGCGTLARCNLSSLFMSKTSPDRLNTKTPATPFDI